MIASVIKLFEKDGDCLSKMSVQEGNKITASDLRVLNGLVEVLASLAELTDCVQISLYKYSGLNLGIISMFDLLVADWRFKARGPDVRWQLAHVSGIALSECSRRSEQS